MAVPRSRRSPIAYDTSSTISGSFRDLISLLEERGWPLFAEGPHQYRTFCPTCEGDQSNSPSLALGRGRYGQTLATCFSGKGGCGLDKPRDERNPQDLRRMFRAFKTAPVPSTAGQTFKRRHPRGKSPAAVGAREVARYTYPNGRVKLRYEWPEGWNKDFRWPRGKGAPMLYQPPTREERRGVVLFVEGEKDVDRLRALGFIATTVSEGYLTETLARQYLRGHLVAVLADYDDHGRHARDAALTALEGIAKRAFFVHLPGLRWRPDHGQDVSDWLDEIGTREQLARLLVAAERKAR